MDLTDCWDCRSMLVEYAIATVLFFSAPVGAFVLRKHIAAATGRWKTAGRLLQALGVVSLPFCVLLVMALLAQLA